MAIFKSFRSTVAPFLSRSIPNNLKVLVDSTTGAPAGIENWNANGADGVFVPIDLTAAQIAAPTALMLADLNATYRLNVAPYTRYQSDGTSLVNLSGSAVIVPASGSIQAAIDALPATGGMVILAPATTYTIATAISSTKNNVHLWAPSWSTIIQRGAALAGTMLLLSGTGCLIEGMTFDGNGSVNITGNIEVQINGANSRITRVQCINSAAVINIAVSAAGGRVDHSTVTGMGTNLSTQRGYGIWANNHVQVTIDHNTVTGTCIDGIGFDGAGSIVDSNNVSSCHWYIGVAGGQIVSYGGGANTTAGAVVSNNTVGQGGSVWSQAIEVNGDGLTVVGNTVRNSYNYGILLNAGSIRTSVLNNYIINSGQNATIDAISVQAGVTYFKIEGNTCVDTQGSATQRDGIRIEPGASDNYIITGNVLTPNAGVALTDGGTGIQKIIRGNVGIDDVTGALGLMVLPATGLLGTQIVYAPWTITANNPVRVFGKISVRTLSA